MIFGDDPVTHQRLVNYRDFNDKLDSHPTVTTSTDSKLGAMAAITRSSITLHPS